MIDFQHIPGYIWDVADDLLRDDRKQSQYPDVILPLTDLARIDCVLAPIRKDVLKKATPEGDPDTWINESVTVGYEIKRSTLTRPLGKIEAEIPGMARRLMG